MKTFPVLWQGPRPIIEAYEKAKCPREIPWEMAEGLRLVAERNHGKTLEQIAERGGMSPLEIKAAHSGTKLHLHMQPLESPSAVRVEAAAARWLREWVGFWEDEVQSWTR